MAGPCVDPPASAAGGIITNGTFDSGTTGWFAFGGGTLSASSMFACAGSAGAVTARTQTYQGPAQSLMGKVMNGQTIGVSGWVRVQGAASAPVNLTMKITAGGVSSYPPVASGTISSTGWTLLSGTTSVRWTGELTELSVYFEGAPVGVDIYVDNAYGINFGVPGGTGTGSPDGSVAVTVTVERSHQTLEGFGASLAWYQDTLAAHAKKAELYPLLFSGLGLDILRYRNRFQRTGESSALADDVANFQAAQTSLGRAPKLLLTSWSPPAAIKANADDDCTAAHSTAKTCTLRKVAGQFDYAGFADYWAASLQAYEQAGLRPTWISIQNEPDFSPSGWEGCVFDPAESATYPGYGKALETVHQRLAALPGRPALLGPETLGIHYNRIQNYLRSMNINLVAGLAHHIYESGSDGIWDWKMPGPDSYADEMIGVSLASGGKPIFQTEFNTDEDGGNTGGFETAWLVHNSLAEESASAFLYWELVWPPSNGADKGLVTLDGPNYRIRDQYYSMKHFAYYTDPGYVRVGAASNLPGIRVSAYRSPDSKRLVVVLLNVGTATKLVTLTPGTFAASTTRVVSSVYEGTRDFWRDQGPLPAAGVSMPARSVSTVVFERP